MVFEVAYKLAQAMLRDSGYRADPLSNEELRKLLQGEGDNTGNRRFDNKVATKKRLPTKTKKGEDICLPFNSPGGCAEGSKSTVTPGSSCQLI